MGKWWSPKASTDFSSCLRAQVAELPWVKRLQTPLPDGEAQSWARLPAFR